MDDTDTLKAVIRRLRRSRDMTQEQLAEALVPKVSDATVSYWETGKATPSYIHAQGLADLFSAPQILTLAGFDADGTPSLREQVEQQAGDYEELKAQFERQGAELAEIKQMLLDLLRRLPDD